LNNCELAQVNGGNVNTTIGQAVGHVIHAAQQPSVVAAMALSPAAAVVAAVIHFNENDCGG